jgi:hypothetical protein
VLAALFAGAIPKFIAVVVVGISLLAVYLGIKKSGKKDQQNADMKATLKAVETRNDVEAEVARESDAAVADDLRRQRNG